MVSADIVQWVQQANPAVTAAVSAYGASVLTRAQDAAADATVGLGQRILQAVWRRRNDQGRAELEAAVQDAVDEPENEDAAAALRQQIKRTLREDAELLQELTAMLPGEGSAGVTVTASGERSIAAGGNIGFAVTGDSRTPQS
jgi:hypothetical protein